MVRATNRMTRHTGSGEPTLIAGGPAFLKGIGNDVLDSILSKNIPYNLEDEKFGEALTSSVARISAVLEGKEDPGPPAKFFADKSKTYKTKVGLYTLNAIDP
jgi:hypothetical protein